MRVTIQVNDLQGLMIAAGLSGNDLAKVLEVDPSLVSKKINGHRRFYSEEIALLHSSLSECGVAISRKKLSELVGHKITKAPDSVRRGFLIGE